MNLAPRQTHDPEKKTTPTPWDAAQPRKESCACLQTLRILTLGAIAMACLIALLPAAGHDQMWLLLSATRMLHGSRLYGPEIFESNPPLIVWISAIPAAIASFLHLPATAVGKLLITVTEAGIALAGYTLLRRSAPLSPCARWALGFSFVAIFAILPARDFGQRDHLLALLCLPYLIAAALRVDGIRLPNRIALAIGVAAGLGLALKPHQTLLPLFVESALLMFPAAALQPRWRRLLRPEPVAIAVVGVLYLLLVRVLAPDYLHVVLPLLRDTYWAFGRLTWPQLVAEAAQLHILIALLAAAIFFLGPHRLPTLPKLLACAGLASTLAYYAQGTGWYYQQLPALSFFALALVLVNLEITRRHPLPLPHRAPLAATALVLLAVALTTHFAGYPFTTARSFPIDTPDPSFFAGLAPGTPVATLTTTVDYTVPPAFRYDLTLAQRYPHLWLLPAILRNQASGANPPSHPIPPGRLAQLEALQHAAMREDFARWNPRLVLVERCQDAAVHCQVLEDRHDNLLAWFLRDPAFQAGFAHYRYLRSAGAFDAYVLR